MGLEYVPQKLPTLQSLALTCSFELDLASLGIVWLFDVMRYFVIGARIDLTIGSLQRTLYVGINAWANFCGL